MALSEKEQRVLRDMERTLTKTDPELARWVGSGGGPSDRRQLWFSAAGVVLGVVLGAVSWALVPGLLFVAVLVTLCAAVSLTSCRDRPNLTMIRRRWWTRGRSQRRSRRWP